MREVGVGSALERFELEILGEQQCVVDIVDDQHATVLLNALPEFPLEIDAARARQFVAAWRERNNIQHQPYDVRAEQREV